MPLSIVTIVTRPKLIVIVTRGGISDQIVTAGAIVFVIDTDRFITLSFRNVAEMFSSAFQLFTDSSSQRLESNIRDLWPLRYLIRVTT